MKKTASGLTKSDLVLNKTGYAVRKAKLYDINVVAQEISRQGKVPSAFKPDFKGCVIEKRDSFQIDKKQHRQIKDCIMALSERKQSALAKAIMAPKLATPAQVEAIKKFVRSKQE